MSREEERAKERADGRQRFRIAIASRLLAAEINHRGIADLPPGRTRWVLQLADELIAEAERGAA